MVESDGKLTDVNFLPDGKIRLWQTDDQTENRAKEKNRPIRPVQLRCRGLAPLRR